MDATGRHAYCDLHPSGQVGGLQMYSCRHKPWEEVIVSQRGVSSEKSFLTFRGVDGQDQIMLMQ
jgi:hypothetical protein